MQAIEGFRSGGSKKVLLASLESFGMGVDLTCACQIILVAPSRNLAVSAVLGLAEQQMQSATPKFGSCDKMWSDGGNWSVIATLAACLCQLQHTSAMQDSVVVMWETSSKLEQQAGD